MNFLNSAFNFEAFFEAGDGFLRMAQWAILPGPLPEGGPAGDYRRNAAVGVHHRSFGRLAGKGT